MSDEDDPSDGSEDESGKRDQLDVFKKNIMGNLADLLDFPPLDDASLIELINTLSATGQDILPVSHGTR